MQAKENNFKAVLESIRDLMNEDCVLPPWLHDILLGYGDPGAAQYKHMDGCLQVVDFKDTFLDTGKLCVQQTVLRQAVRRRHSVQLPVTAADHVREAFPGWEIEFRNGSRSPQLERPFRITFPPLKEDTAAPNTKGRAATNGAAPGGAEADAKGKLLVESYTPVDPGPYPQDLPPQNRVRFTPVQTQAIMSGVQPGLTMVVGPPGTGKTDTAVQIMHILYHNCPSQRTLVVTHSNQALNDLFTKVRTGQGTCGAGAHVQARRRAPSVAADCGAGRACTLSAAPRHGRGRAGH